MTDRPRTPDSTGPGSSPWPVDALASRWAAALGATVHVPLSAAEISAFLRDQLERLAAALTAPSDVDDAAADVGARLVGRGFVGPQSLSRTVSVLITALPLCSGGPEAQRAVDLLGGLVSGYVAALRTRIVDQHQEIKQVLLQSRHEVEAELRASEARFREVFVSSPVGIAISDPNTLILRSNPALDAMLGYRPGELAGQDLADLIEPDDLPQVEEQYQLLLEDVGADLPGPEHRARVRLRRKDGELCWTTLAISAHRDADRRPLFLITTVEDVGDVHLLQQRLNHQALHDLRTGLPNRQYFLSHLEGVLGRHHPSETISLLQLDLDGFSAVNDGLGPRFGDALLEVVAARLSGIVSELPAMVARLGSDEFGIVVEPPLSPAEVAALAERINADLAEPTYVDGVGIAATATIAVVQREVSGATPEGLLRDATATLNRLRGRVSNQWALFDSDIDAAVRAEQRLAAELPGALENGAVSVVYQPVATLNGRELVAVAAVPRWEHPTAGLVTGERCLRIAEHSGVVHALGDLLLQSAAQQAADWRDTAEGPPPVMVVDLAAHQVQDPLLVAKVRAVLARTGLPASALQLCFPSTAVRSENGHLAGEAGAGADDTLGTLADLGVGLGLYDFAGGIGGLRCVAELPIRTVRVAEPVSRQVLEDPSRILSQTVHAVTHIVRGSDVNVVAYPLESEEQADCWRWVGANWAMGPLVGAPVAAEVIAQRFACVSGE